MAKVQCYMSSYSTNLQNSMKQNPSKMSIFLQIYSPAPFFYQLAESPSDYLSMLFAHHMCTNASAKPSAFKYILWGVFTDFTPAPLQSYPLVSVHWGLSWSYGKKAPTSDREGRVWDRAHARFGNRTWGSQRSHCPHAHVEMTSLCLAIGSRVFHDQLHSLSVRSGSFLNVAHVPNVRNSEYS